MTHETEKTRDTLKVCYRCLLAIECHEGEQITRKIYIEDDDNETRCEWCENTPDDGGFCELYEIL